jgi:hypothetical protein
MEAGAWPPVVRGDDGHFYVPATFFDAGGVPVEGWRRLTDEERGRFGYTDAELRGVARDGEAG